MKRIYFILPCLALTAFAGYFRHWETGFDARKTGYAKDDFLDPYRHRDGRKDAEADIAHGKLRIVSYGLPVHWAPEYREIMQRDYGVEVDSIAGCVVSGDLVKYAAAYNEVMQARILARHGKQVFDDAVAKAEALYAERHQPKPSG